MELFNAESSVVGGIRRFCHFHVSGELDMRSLQLSSRKHKVVCVSIGMIFALVLLVSFLIVQRWYANEKMARFERCADFSAMPAVTDSKDGNRIIVMIGDSRIAEWPFGELHTRFRVLNWGVPGATVPELLCGLGRYSTWHGADVYIVQAGINDLVAISAAHRWQSDGRKQEISRTNLAYMELVRVISSGGQRTIVLETLPPIGLDVFRKLIWGSHVSASVEAFVKMQSQYGYPSNVSHLPLVPIFFNNETREWRGELSRDALHWRSSAYRAIERNLFDIE